MDRLQSLNSALPLKTPAADRAGLGYDGSPTDLARRAV
jgi:hypothetical protein